MPLLRCHLSSATCVTEGLFFKEAFPPEREKGECLFAGATGCLPFKTNICLRKDVKIC